MDPKIKEDYIRTVKISSGKVDVVKDKIYIDSFSRYKRQSSSDICVAGATDFAQALGADANPYKTQSATGQFCGDIVLRSTIGHLDNYIDVVNASSSNQGSKQVNDPSGLICPVVYLPLSVLDKKLPFGAYNVNQVGSYYTISFEKLVYPQKLAQNQEELDVAMSKGLLAPTGKNFSGKMLYNHELETLPEYEYHGKKYVSVSVEKIEITLPQGRKLRQGSDYWFEVSPIIWQVRNHENVSQINHFAAGNDNHLELRTQSGIISGIPFYPTDVDLQDSNEWQNSIIRAFLNGINIHEEIRRKNGLLKKRLPENFDFTGKGFIDQMYEDNSIVKTVAATATAETPKKKTYGYGVTISTDKQSIDDQIKFYVENGKSFMLHGASGVGKSRRVKEIDPDCVMIQLRDGILPEEIIGKTAYEKDRSVWLPPTWYTSICNICAKDPYKNHVLFIDEITNVKPYEQSLVFHIVLERSIDGSVGRLPDNCVVVAAGNSIYESDAAHNMPEPLFRRFNGHINLPLSVDAFVSWGCQLNDEGRPKVHPIVLAYVASHRQLLHSKYDSEKPPEFAIDPRGWEQISDIIYANDEVIRLELIENKIGHDNAIDFCNFAKTPLITIDEIMNNDIDTRKIPTDFNAQHVLCLTLRVATEEQVPKVRKFIKKYLGGEHLAHFDSIWAEGNDERALLIGRLNGEKGITENEALITGNLNNL